MEITGQGPADPQGRDAEDPPAHLPRGQLLRRPVARHAVGADVSRRRHDPDHADRRAGAARPGAHRAAERHARGPQAAARGLRHGADLSADRRPTTSARTRRSRARPRAVAQQLDRTTRPARSGTRRSSTRRFLGIQPHDLSGWSSTAGKVTKALVAQRGVAQGPRHQLQHDDGRARRASRANLQRDDRAARRRRSSTPTRRSRPSTRRSRTRARSPARSCPACARRPRRSTRRSRGSRRPASWSARRSWVACSRS